MTFIISSLFSYLMTSMGFMADRTILLAANPVGFFLTASSIVYTESMIVKSINKDDDQIIRLEITETPDVCKEYLFLQKKDSVVS